MLPFEFVVIGKPISHQTKQKKSLQSWKEKVREAAESCWTRDEPLGSQLKITITHYYDCPVDDDSAVPDSDNIVKPIRDALNGFIYVDDYQITDFVSRRRNLNGSFKINGISYVLAEGFSSNQEFLHIKIELAPDPETLKIYSDKDVAFSPKSLVLPFEFIVIGKPISHITKQKKSLQSWKEKVREAAESCWTRDEPLGSQLKVTITHYYDCPVDDESAVPDSDNIVKPIRDALNGFIYVDDYQITDFISRRRNINNSFQYKEISSILAEGLSQDKEFIHLKIDVAPDPEELTNFSDEKALIGTQYQGVLPFEFVVIGKPISHQTKQRKSLQVWEKKVREAAESCWTRDEPLGSQLKVTITHYYDCPVDDESAVPDSDNIVKPIRDALNGFIYVDDYQITDFVTRHRNLNGSFRYKGMSSVLAEGFSSSQEFLHIKIERATTPEKNKRLVNATEKSNFRRGLDNNLDKFSPTSRKDTLSYSLTLTSSVEKISIGDKLIVTINLIPSDINSNNAYLIEVPQDEAINSELNIVLVASCFQCDGNNVTSLPFNSNTAQVPQSASFCITALRPGKFTIAAEVYRGDIFETALKTQVQVTDDSKINFTTKNITTQSRPVPQPDFILRICNIWDEKNSTCKFSYLLKSFRLPSVFSGKINYYSVSFSSLWLEKIQNLLAITLKNISNGLPEEGKYRMVSLGQYLFEHLFPNELQGDFRSLIPPDRIFTLLIIAERDPWIPWEILYDGQKFLGERFIIGRWLSELNDTRPYEFPVGTVNVAHYANVEQPQRWANLLKAPGAPQSQLLPEGVLHNSSETIRGLHLIRYSQSADTANRQNAPVILDYKNDNDTEDIESQIRPTKLNLRRHRPLVTLGYVKIATPELTTLKKSWASTFIQTGCSAYISSVWSVDSDVEAAFISNFYKYLWTGASLGEAFHRSRQLARAIVPDSLDWLAYVMFGDPMARPYLPVEGKGYAVIEPIGREIEDPLPPNVPIRFRLSLRRIPPVWHEERVIEVAQDLSFENLRVHVKTMGLQVTPNSPIEMSLAPNGNYLGWFTLVAPSEMVDNSALVQVYFMDGVLPIHSLMFSLNIENEGGK